MRFDMKVTAVCEEDGCDWEKVYLDEIPDDDAYHVQGHLGVHARVAEGCPLNLDRRDIWDRGDWWIDATGKVWRLDEMEADHLMNVIMHVGYRCREHVAEKLKSGEMLEGDALAWMNKHYPDQMMHVLQAQHPTEFTLLNMMLVIDPREFMAVGAQAELEI